MFIMTQRAASHPVLGGQASAERRAGHLLRRRRALERIGAAACFAAACRAAAAQLGQQRRILLPRGRQCMPAVQWDLSLLGPAVAPYRQPCDRCCLHVTAPYMLQKKPGLTHSSLITLRFPPDSRSQPYSSPARRRYIPFIPGCTGAAAGSRRGRARELCDAERFGVARVRTLRALVAGAAGALTAAGARLPLQRLRAAASPHAALPRAAPRVAPLLVAGGGRLQHVHLRAQLRIGRLRSIG